MCWDKKPGDDSRALLDDELKAFIGENSKKMLKPYVDLVKKYNKDLVLCFRGNTNPRITIYSRNHIVFTVLTSGRVEISFNHARYCEKWEEYFNILKNEYDFSGKIDTTESGNKTVGVMSRAFRGKTPLGYDQIEDIYLNVLKPIINKYFDVEGKENVVDYFKHEERVKVYGKLEKIRQQELFEEFSYIKDGYFFYDLEFAQKHKDKDELDNDEANNKPDMQAIKFDKKGKPDKIVFVEVKSTSEAMRGASGLKEHWEKMLEYDRSRMPARIKEAYQIMKQYAALELEGLSKNVIFDYKDFEKIPCEPEILFVFTDDAKDIWESEEFKKERDMTQIVEYSNPKIKLYRIKNEYMTV